MHAFSNGTIGPYLLGFFGVIVAVSLGLIAWRGDRLRSPGAIDSPISREGAFLANNVIFTVFAFVVLLGTVFPLIVEALQDRQIAVGPPFFDRLSMPIGITLLFLMAVAPVLPWRKASTELLRDRLFWPAWCGVGTLAISVIAGADGFAPLLAFFLGGFAAGAALRQLVLALRRQGWRGLVGRANGGMVVHLGVIVIAVALAASNSYTRVAEFTLQPGVPVSYGGHTFELVKLEQFTDARSTGVKAADQDRRRPDVRAGDHDLHQLRHQDPDAQRAQQRCSTISTSRSNRVCRFDGTEAPVKIFIKPLVVWLWIGGMMMAVGTVLAGFPGRRRRLPTDPVSAPIELEPVGV